MALSAWTVRSASARSRAARFAGERKMKPISATTTPTVMPISAMLKTGEIDERRSDKIGHNAMSDAVDGVTHRSAAQSARPTTSQDETSGARKR